jgi:hypothetical protein
MKDSQVEVGFAGEEEPRGPSLDLTFGREIDVLPAGEQVEVVPSRASMTEKYEIEHPLSVVLRSNAPGVGSPLEARKTTRLSGVVTLRVILLDKQGLNSVAWLSWILVFRTVRRVRE